MSDTQGEGAAVYVEDLLNAAHTVGVMNLDLQEHFAFCSDDDPRPQVGKLAALDAAVVEFQRTVAAIADDLIIPAAPATKPKD